MVISNKADFLRTVRASRVVSADKLNRFLQNSDREDVPGIAAEMVTAGLLTSWQAKFLCSGRHQLNLGNYVLLERIRRDELGDRFLARHRQLGRVVEIQVLPADLSRQPERRQKFLERSQLVATLDHPNLTHVLDIDEEGGRLYLVAEQVKGRALSEFPVAELTPLDVGRIVEQVLAGLDAAHRNGLSHGRIHPESVWISEEGEVKIRQLVLAALADLAVPAEPVDDINNVGQLGRRLLSQVDGASSAPGRKQLFDCLADLATARPADLEPVRQRLNEWLEVFGKETATGTIRPVAGTLASTEPLPEMPTPTPAKMAPTPPPARNSDSGPMLVLTTDPSRVRLLFGVLVVAGLLVIAVITWLLANSANPSRTANVNRKSKGGNAAEQTRGGVKKQTAPLVVPKDLDIDAMLEEGTSRAPDRTGGNPPPDAPPPVTDPPVTDPPVTDPPVTDPPVTDPPGTDPPATDPATTEPPTTDPATLATAGSAPPEGGETMQPVPPTEAGDATPLPALAPFAGIPKRISLPPRTQSEEVVVAEFPIPANFLLAVELIAGREISKSRIEFSLERDPANPQRWIIRGNPRNESPLDVAALRYSETRLSFQWFPAASGDDFEWAEYLRNALLKLSADGEPRILVLREPVVIDGFQLAANVKRVSPETQIDWLPNNDCIRVELQPLQLGDLSAPVLNALAERRTPGVYALHGDPIYYDALKLLVKPEIRRKLELTAELEQSVGGKPEPCTIEGFKESAQEFKRQADGWSREFFLLDQPNARPAEMPAEQFNKFKDEAKKRADNGQTIAAELLNIAARLETLSQTPIPVVVSFEMEGHRVVLATSVAGNEGPPPAAPVGGDAAPNPGNLP